MNIVLIYTIKEAESGRSIAAWWFIFGTPRAVFS